MLPVPEKLQTITEAHENLSELMIEITNQTSLTFCNEVLQIPENASLFQWLLCKIRTHESILDHQKK